MMEAVGWCTLFEGLLCFGLWLRVGLRKYLKENSSSFIIIYSSSGNTNWPYCMIFLSKIIARVCFLVIACLDTWSILATCLCVMPAKYIKDMTAARSFGSDLMAWSVSLFIFSSGMDSNILSGTGIILIVCRFPDPVMISWYLLHFRQAEFPIPLFQFSQFSQFMPDSYHIFPYFPVKTA